MAEMFDAASRLAEGRPAVAAVQDYVWACHLLGYQDQDLTLHPSQVSDWYGSEDGIDLVALDADCEALRAVAAATEGALARQDAQYASMAAAWQGPGAVASREFLRRHGEAAAAVVAAVRRAAESLGSLRDHLWHRIDGKVAATISTAAAGERPDWRAAAQTVTTGAGDRAIASELVEQEVKPFVDNDIRSEWLTAMRSALAAMTSAYDAAAAELTAEIPAAFVVPGDFGPSWSPPSGEGVMTIPASVSSTSGPVASGSVAAPAGAAPAPSAWPSSPAAVPLSAPPLPASPPLSPAAAPVDPAAMTPPSLPSMGGGMPDVGSGLAGFGGQLGDLLGNLVGSSQDALSDLPEVEEPEEVEEPDDIDPLDEDDDALDDDALDEDALDEDEAEADRDEAEAEVDEAEDEEPESAKTEAEEEPPPAVPLPAEAEPVAAPIAAPPPIEPLDAPAPATVTETPCEIAADELPQVGE